MGAGVSNSRNGLAALSQVMFCSCTPHIAVPGWTTSSSKGSRPRSFHCSQEPQLMANDCGISQIPVGIAQSSPLSKEEHLNTSLCCIDSFNHSDSTRYNCVIYSDICRSLYIDSEQSTYKTHFIIQPTSIVNISTIRQ